MVWNWTNFSIKNSEGEPKYCDSFLDIKSSQQKDLITNFNCKVGV